MAIGGLELRSLLIGWQFWALELQFVLVLITTGREWPRLVRRLPRARGTVTAALAAAAMAWMLTAYVAPRTNRIYYDEHIYQGIGQNLSDLHLAQMCNDGTVEYGRLQCWRGEYNKEPNGYPYVLSLVYRIAGVSEVTAFRLNNVVAALSAFLAVILAALLFEDLEVAALSGLILALVPMQLVWSNTAAAEPAAALFSALAVLAAIQFVRTRTTSALLWMVAVGSFATTFRPESILIVPLVGLIVVVLAPREIATVRIWWALALGVALTSVTWMHLLAVRNESWGNAGGRLAWAYAKSNFPTNFWFYLADGRFPVMVSVAAVIGVLAPGFRREKALLCAYFLIFWGIFVFFYAGSYNYGADVRYSLLSNIPLSVLAAAGATWLGRILSRRWRAVRPFATASSVILFQFLWYLPLVRATGEESWAARADVAFAKTFARSLPANALVLTHNPSMFHLWGINAAQMSLAVTDRPYVDGQLLSRYGGGVFLYWNFWCNVSDPVQASFCRTTLDSFPHELVVEHMERDYRYALYRLKTENTKFKPQSF